MTDQDRCNNAPPHPAHSRFGLKDCPGVPITAANAPAVPTGPAPASADGPRKPPHDVQLAVEYADHQTRYYPANPGWRVDAARRCIVIGRDLPRTYIPLDRVVAWTVERVEREG